MDASQLLELDVFEGLSAGEIEGSESRRVKAVVYGPNGKTVAAWVWEWIGPFDGKDVLVQGDWIAVDAGDV